MKNDYEMYQSVLSRRDKYRRKKEKHIRMIKRTAALTLGTAAVLGIGIFTRAMKPPKKPTPNQSGIITETETTSAETMVAPTSPSTIAPKTTATEMTTVTTTATPHSVQKTSTTIHTTTVVARTTIAADGTTKESETSQHLQTKVSQTTTAPLNTTTQAAVTTTAHPTTTKYAVETVLETTRNENLEFPTETSKITPTYNERILKNFGRLELQNGQTYVIYGGELTQERVGKVLDELTLTPNILPDGLPDEVSAKVSNITNISPNYAMSVKFDGFDANRIYVNFDYNPETLGDLLDDTNFLNVVKLSKAYVGTSETDIDGEKVMTFLEKHRECVNQNDAFSNAGKELLSVGVDIPIFSVYGISLQITQNGYITTNIAARGAYFFVGSEETQKLADELLNGNK